VWFCPFGALINHLLAFPTRSFPSLLPFPFPRSLPTSLPLPPPFSFSSLCSSTTNGRRVLPAPTKPRHVVGVRAARSGPGFRYGAAPLRSHTVQGGVQRDVKYGLNSGPCPPGASGDLSQEWRFRHVEILNSFALASLPLTSRSSR